MWKSLCNLEHHQNQISIPWSTTINISDKNTPLIQYFFQFPLINMPLLFFFVFDLFPAFFSPHFMSFVTHRLCYHHRELWTATRWLEGPEERHGLENPDAPGSERETIFLTFHQVTFSARRKTKRKLSERNVKNKSMVRFRSSRRTDLMFLCLALTGNKRCELQGVKRTHCGDRWHSPNTYVP